MANFFDQFDVPTPPSPPRPPAPPQRPEGANFFDQFDAQPAAPVAAPEAPFADLPVPDSVDPLMEAITRPERNAALDLAGQAAAGGLEGLGSIADLPALLEQGARSIGPAVSNTLFGTEFAMPEPFIPRLGSNLVDAVDDAGLLAGAPDGPAETILRRTGQELGAATVPIAGKAALAAKPLTSAAKEVALTLGSGAGAGVAQSVAGEDNIWADLLGQVAGAGIVGGTQAIPRLVTPNPADPQTQKAAATLADEGVHLTAGQKTGNKNLQYVESMIGRTTAEEMADVQAEQFTSAALRRAGITADRATPEVMDAAFSRIGQDFDSAVAGTTMPLDQQMATEIMQVLDDYNSFVPGGMQAPVIKNVVDGLSQQLNTSGMLDGATYQAYRSQIDKAARGASSNPYLQDALFGIRSAMDGAVERGLAQTNPDLVDVWKQARREYRNLLVLEKAASRGGEAVASGIITPQNLRQAVEQQNTRMYVRGQGDFADLARAGNIAMPQLPNSGTAQRLLAVLKPAAAAGAGIGANVTGQDLMTSAAATAGTFALPQIAEKAIMSPPVQGYLGNQLLAKGATASQGPLTFSDWLEQATAGIPVGPVAGAYGQQQIDGEDSELMRYLAANM